MTEIFINGKAIDLNDETIVLSFGVNNLFSIESTQGVYSNTFKIPATHKNNLAFGISNNILSASNIPFESLSCEIYVNGLIAVAGIAQIQSASRFEYEILIVAGNGNWIDKLQDLNLQSVLFSCEFTQFWKESTVTGSRSNIWSDVFIYPNIDYGNLFFLAGSNVDWNELLPSIYCKFLLKKIFNDIGYNINSDWFDNNTTFQKQIIPFSARFQRSTDTSLRDQLKSTASADFSPPSNLFAPNGDKFHIMNTNETSCYPYVNQVKWIDPFSIPFFDINAGKCWLFMDSAFVKFKYDITVDRQFNTASFDYSQILYYDHAGNQQYFQIYDLMSQPIGIYNFQGEVTLPIGRGAVAFGTETNAIWKAGSTIEITGFELSSDSGALDINTVFNWVELGATLPDMAVTDFILTLANQYGLIFQESANTNTIEIFQFSDVINNLTNPKDWSNKLDLSDEPVITFEVDSYAKKNFFQYAPDTVDEYLTRQPLLGRASLDINQANLIAEQVLFESVFSASVRLLSYSGTIELFYIPVYEGTGTNDVNARIACVEQDTSALLTIQPSGFFTNPQPNVFFKDLEFGQLLPKYYPLYSQILNNMKSVKCLIKLNSVDVNTINFKEPIWIDFFGAYFYLNLIDQFNLTTQDSTPVELILLRN
jgi:hypothetical protein